MTVEKDESGLTTNRRLRNFDAALEDSDVIGMVTSNADSGKGMVSLQKDGAVEEAERLAKEYGMKLEIKEDNQYGRRAQFEIEYPDF